MQQPAHTIAQHSYTRCLRAPDFFTAFYGRLLSSDPAIPPMFANTEFPRQHKLLQHGLGLLLSYSKRPDPALLERIAARHSAGGVDVPEKWLLGSLDAFFRSTLLQERSLAREHVDADGLRRLLDAHPTRLARERLLLGRLTSLELHLRDLEAA